MLLSELQPSQAIARCMNSRFVGLPLIYDHCIGFSFENLSYGCLIGLYVIVLLTLARFDTRNY